MAVILSVEHLACGYGDRCVVEDFSAQVETGEIHCLLGSSGVGKTTLFETILGLIPRMGGKALVDGKDAKEFSVKQFAQVIAYVSQAHVPPFAFTVRDAVVMGRMAHMGVFSSPGKEDYACADEATERLGIGKLAGHVYTELSCGERQMTLIARAFAQQPQFLMMDEPTAALDFGNQAQVLSAVKHLSESGLGVIMTTHAPDHLLQCNAGTLLLRDGVYLRGSAEELLTTENLQRAYGIEVMVLDSTWRGEPVRFCRPVVK